MCQVYVHQCLSQENTANFNRSNTSENVKKVSFVQRDFRSLYVPSGCLLNAVCCLAEYLHSPTHCHRITKKPLPSSSACTAGQSPKRPQLIISREGRNPQTICLVRNTTAQQMEAGLAYLKPVLFFFFPSSPYLLWRLRPCQTREREICWREQIIGAFMWGGFYQILPLCGM